MKTLRILVFLLALFLVAGVSAQNNIGASFHLFTDPAGYASGKTNLGFGAILGVYDRYLCDYGFFLNGSLQNKHLDPIAGGRAVRLDNRIIQAGARFYPFGLRDKIAFERRSHNERLRFHHRRMIHERNSVCPNACFGRRDLNLDKWLKGFYVGAAYEHGKSVESHLDGPTGKLFKQVSYRHGLQIDLGYTLTVEFLSLSLNWTPLGLVSIPYQGASNQPNQPRSVEPREVKYQPDLSFTIGIALFN